MPNVLSPRDLVSRLDSMDETVLSSSASAFTSRENILEIFMGRFFFLFSIFYCLCMIYLICYYLLTYLLACLLTFLLSKSSQQLLK